MTDKELDDFREYISGIDASYDEWKMLIAFMVNEASAEYMHRKMLEEADED
jgi:hypothetical protein